MRFRRSTWIAIMIVSLYFALQMVSLKSIALTDDDDFYIPAGISYAGWLGRAITFQGDAWSRTAIDAAFTTNREHPPFAKYVFGICHFALARWLGPTDSARVGTVLFSTLAAAMLLWMAIGSLGERRGLRVGGLAVLALLTLPRFYFHSHAATLDVPVAAMYLATAALILRAERSTWALFLVGPVFGLATATKLNAPFVVVPYLIFAVLTRWRGRGKVLGDGLRLPPIPGGMLSMAILGPIVFFAIWPWMWFELPARVTEYVKFHVNHYGIYFLYFGQIYDKPFAPWHAPFVMAASTIPLATSVLALGGLGYSVSAVIDRFRAGSSAGRRAEGDLLLFVSLNAAVSIALVAFAGTPKYGGAKLFMPFFPFWCLLAGYAGNRIYEELAERWHARRPHADLALLIPGVLCASGVMLQLHFGAYGLSEYNGLVNGARGATAIGFERQYYDLAFRDLVSWLSEEAPENLRVHFLPNNWEYVRTYKWYRQAGELRKDIQVTQSERSAQWIVITHERRFRRYAGDLEKYRGHKVLREKRVDGVPIWTVVEAR